VAVPDELSKAIASAVGGLGYELVDVESGGRGLVRVFIDKTGGISVKDCEKVSNHLTRVFAVENLDYERLEVSSPGLDRPLRSREDFTRFAGARVRLRLRIAVDGRKRFDAIVGGPVGGLIEFSVIEQEAAVPAKGKRGTQEKAGKAKPAASEVARLRVSIDDIEKCRLVPEI
jgi:ribosome maturation factor RimP